MNNISPDPLAQLNNMDSALSQPLLRKTISSTSTTSIEDTSTTTPRKRPPANTTMTRLRQAFGFSQGYNFGLFAILVGILMTFTLSQFSYVDVDGSFCVSGDEFGECYFDFMRLALKIHLRTIFPASFLVCFQFVPVVRRKFRTFHRVNGYVVLALSLVGAVGGFMSSRHAFGGEVGSHALSIVYFGSFAGSMIMGVINIWKRRIELHRAWMIRGWVYVSPDYPIIATSCSNELETDHDLNKRRAAPSSPCGSSPSP